MHKEIKLSNREIIIKRTFKMSCNKNLCDSEKFHNFSRWAKGKSESQIMNHIHSGELIPEVLQLT